MKRQKKISELNREELINLCRYYRGQEHNPYEGEKDTNRSMLWFYESVWVTMSLQEKEHEGDGILAEYLADYVGAGLKDFRIDDAIPMTLKAFLFNRFRKGSMDGDTTPFKTFFNKYY